MVTEDEGAVAASAAASAAAPAMETGALLHSWPARYGLAVVVTAAALLARLALGPLLGADAPLLLFVLAVAVSAAWGGLGPGLLATALAMALGDYFLLAPVGAFGISGTSDLVRAGLFCLEGAFIALLIESRRRAGGREAEGLRALSESRARLAGVVESAMDAIVVVDERQRVAAFNPAAERMFGYAPGEAEGMPLEELLPEQYRRGHEGHVARFGRDGAADSARSTGGVPGMLRGRRKGGEEFPVEATVSRVRQAGGQTLFTAVVRDVTERERAAAALQEAARRQRRFVREMLFSATEGRLRLCEGPGDLPPPLEPASETVELSGPTLRLLRKRAEAVAEGLRLPKERGHDLVTAVGEAGMNAVVHAGGGEGRVCADRERGVLQVWVTDAGGGISEESLHKATIERGWTTAGSLGHGFFLMLRTCDRVYLLTGAGGTTVVLEQEKEEPPPHWLQ